MHVYLLTTTEFSLIDVVTCYYMHLYDAISKQLQTLLKMKRVLGNSQELLLRKCLG